MLKNPRTVFLLIVVLTIFLFVLDIPEGYHLQTTLFGQKIDRTFQPIAIDLTRFGIAWKKEIKTHLGLDLSGGTHLALEADMKDVPTVDQDSALESAKEVIERRVNFFGVSEPVVQTAKSDRAHRIIVELPGVGNVEEAMALLGQTAKMEFREFIDDSQATSAALFIPTIFTTKSVGISGKDLKHSQLEFSSQTGEPEVSLEFSSEGGKKFADVTRRLTGKHLAIFLDDFPLTWPRVNTEIADGRAVITGQFTKDQAKTLALQLNAGALPVPVSVVEKRSVGASLGQESVVKSIRAGLIGLGVVAMFMIAQYGRLGLIADMALLVYGIVSLALFRLIPITLTLPGITGFILSIGMAVDSNILIFERFKEEKRAGKPWYMAMEQGFGKAWDSIRDANVTTILTALILYNPGNWSFLPSSGLVRGFAVTLLLGVFVSLFTGLIVSRTFIRVLYREKNL